MKGKFVIGCVVASCMAANPGFAADSLLSSGPPGPCAAAMEGPDYVAGVDAAGRPVPRADLGAEHVSLPDQVFVPLPARRPNRGSRGGRAGMQAANGPYAAIDGRRLDPLINPDACPGPTPSSKAPPRQR
ncbi:MAG: hypothetical protein JO256_05565 [Alphaproteobacteria bacterium]|nr:hypothetical protein [Alphaproteobacteria bacterium]